MQSCKIKRRWKNEQVAMGYRSARIKTSPAVNCIRMLDKNTEVSGHNDLSNTKKELKTSIDKRSIALYPGNQGLIKLYIST